MEWGRKLLTYGSVSFIAGLLGIVVLRSNFSSSMRTPARLQQGTPRRSLRRHRIDPSRADRPAADAAHFCRQQQGSATPVSRLLVVILSMLSVLGAVLAKPVIVAALRRPVPRCSRTDPDHHRGLRHPRDRISVRNHVLGNR